MRGGHVANTLGDEGREGLAGCWGGWSTAHHLSLVEGGGGACRGPVPGSGGTPLLGMVSGWGRRGTGPTQGGAQRPACLESALLLVVCMGVEVLDVIGRTLRLGCRLHQERRVVAQDLHPALEVGRAGVEGRVGDAAHATQVGGAHFGDQLFFGIRWIAKEAQVGERGSVEPRAVPCGVDVMPISA
jgi:hypothetical protein